MNAKTAKVSHGFTGDEILIAAHAFSNEAADELGVSRIDFWKKSPEKWIAFAEAALNAVAESRRNGHA